MLARKPTMIRKKSTRAHVAKQRESVRIAKSRPGSLRHSGAAMTSYRAISGGGGGGAQNQMTSGVPLGTYGGLNALTVPTASGGALSPGVQTVVHVGQDNGGTLTLFDTIVKLKVRLYT